jgi:hypothetical protein
MGATAGILFGAGGFLLGAAGLIGDIIQGNQANNIAQQQAIIAQQNLDLSKQQLEIQKQGNYLSGQSVLLSYDKAIADMEASKSLYGIEIRNAESQVESYDMWLGNYGAQYAQAVASKQAQTDQLQSSGQEAYENFLNAIGYSDAQAGATGRVGAGTSQAFVTAGIDRKLVDYVGADRTLDAYGGLYGAQLTAANLEMEQLKVDLEFLRYEMEQNRSNTLASISDYQRAIALTDQSIVNSRAARNELEQFIELNFKEKEEKNESSSSGFPDVGVAPAGYSGPNVIKSSTVTNIQPGMYL